MLTDKILSSVESPIIHREVPDREFVSATTDGGVDTEQRRLKVLFVPEWYPNEEHKFFGTFCREHARAAALYADVAVLSVFSRPERWPTMHWKEMNDEGIPTFYATYGHSPIPKTTLPVFLLHLRRALHRVMKKWGRPDIIHTQDSRAYYVIRVAQQLGIPAVMSQHWTGFMERSIPPKLVRQFKYAFAHAACVLPDNKFAGEHYRHYELPARVRWLPNTISTDTFFAIPHAQRKPWLLHASGLTYQKRFADIIQAFARVLRDRPGVVLQVVGDGGHRAECEELAKRELPPGSFHFHGFLPKTRLADLMRQALGFILPSEAENLPCVLIEALACACPVLTTRVGGITALVGEKDGILVDVGNIDQIAEGMCRLLDGTHGIDMERLSREVGQQYSHVTVGRILHEEYRKALNNG